MSCHASQPRFLRQWIFQGPPARSPGFPNRSLSFSRYVPQSEPVACSFGLSIGIGITLGRKTFRKLGQVATVTKAAPQLKDYMAKNYVVTDGNTYCVAIALLLSPLAITSEALAPLLLVSLATLTVYLGSRAPPILPNAALTLQTALTAPLFLGVLLVGLYTGPKLGLDSRIPYREFVCLIGAFLGLENVITNGLAARRPLPISEPLETSVLSVTIAALIVLVYFLSSGPLAFAACNLIAASLAVFGVRAIVVDSFQVAAVFLIGCICYDVAFVFGTDMMATVVKQIEAPVIVRISKSLTPENSAVALGLGDIVFPGVGVAFLRKFGENAKGAYFMNALIAYAVGVSIALFCNTYLQNGQPALLYIIPAILFSALLTAASEGELSALLTAKQQVGAAEVVEEVSELEAGVLLVARDADTDAMFGASVILLLEHDSSAGSLGVVINRKLCKLDQKTLAQTLRDYESIRLPEFLVPHSTERNALELLEGDVRLGGPAGLGLFPFQGTIVLHSDPSISNARVAIQARGDDEDLLWSYLSELAAPPRGSILMIGLSSWSEGQLSREMRCGTWGVAQASTDDAWHPENVWERLTVGCEVKCFDSASFGQTKDSKQ